MAFCPAAAKRLFDALVVWGMTIDALGERRSVRQGSVLLARIRASHCCFRIVRRPDIAHSTYSMKISVAIAQIARDLRATCDDWAHSCHTYVAAFER
jgi:hypothetical protein